MTHWLMLHSITHIAVIVPRPLLLSRPQLILVSMLSASRLLASLTIYLHYLQETWAGIAQSV